MRKIAFKSAAVLALVASAQLQAQQTQQAEVCLTRPEVRGMVAYFLPAVLKSTIDTCTPQLKSDSYLIGRAPRLLGALEADRTKAWPMAKQAVIKLGGERGKGMGDVLANLPEDAVGPMIGAVVTQELSKEIKPENCGDIDRVLAPLEPLPSTNLVDTLTEVMMLAGRNGKKMRACRES